MTRYFIYTRFALMDRLDFNLAVVGVGCDKTVGNPSLITVAYEKVLLRVGVTWRGAVLLH